jgi:hypothetical protein
VKVTLAEVNTLAEGLGLDQAAAREAAWADLAQPAGSAKKTPDAQPHGAYGPGASL